MLETSPSKIKIQSNTNEAQVDDLTVLSSQCDLNTLSTNTTFKCQMVKHKRRHPTNCSSMFDHFYWVGEENIFLHCKA